MNVKAIALIALAAVGLGAGTSFDAYAYGRYECLTDCRADYDDCLADGGSAAVCSAAYSACRHACFKYY